MMEREQAKEILEKMPISTFNQLPFETVAESVRIGIESINKVESIKRFCDKHKHLDSLELMCIMDIINGEFQE
jgi:hypothetical protein